MTRESTALDQIQFDLFIEQAEYIESDKFQEWTIDHPDEEVIVRKLSQAGAKLITGPRGCGKTTLLLKVFHKLKGEPRHQTLPVYVNFKSSLKLEPFYTTNANASFLFQQWLLYKIYAGLYEVLDQIGVTQPNGLSQPREKVVRLIQHLEIGRSDAFSAEDCMLSSVTLDEDLLVLLESLGYKRCVLLLDDAAHAFSSEQQRDFFEFFRSIKSKHVSPKAAIYPGVTIYSPTFHVGHDAEDVDVWLKPDAPSYLPFMKRLLEQRLPGDVWSQFSKTGAILDLIAFASFGVPRAMLNMVRSLYKGDDAASLAVDMTRSSTLKAIKNSFENTLNVFGSLRQKLPMYSVFIEAGRRLFDKCVESIKDYNRGKDVGDQSVTIAVKKPLPQELAKVFGFYQYAGLVLPRGEISRGIKGVFELFVVHYAALVDHNALVVKKSVNTAAYVEAFQKRQSKEFTRITPRILLGTENASEILKLSLPPCQHCRTPRIAESARFCLNCGQPLKSLSVFEALVGNDIAELNLTGTRVASIKAHCSIRTIKDILLDHEHKQLRSVPRIGPVWAKRIYSYAEEFIA